MDQREDEKRAAAQAAALLVEEGMRVGLGTGSTVAHFLPALAQRELDLVCVATSPATEQAARALGLAVQPFDVMGRLDLAVDGADQVSADLWLVKGGGGAHTREKIVASAADRFVVVVSSDKLVESLHPPIPLEVLRFGEAATLRRLSSYGEVQRRRTDPSPDGNVIVDYLGPVGEPASLSAELDAVPGVVAHGLFAPSLVSEVLVGKADSRVDRLAPADR
jgi:ribose 5-phosphate isomerase A